MYDLAEVSIGDDVSFEATVGALCESCIGTVTLSTQGKPHSK